MDRPDAVKPDIEVRQVSDKRIEIYSRDGRKLASHRPRGWLSSRIGIWDLDDRQWEMDYSLSPAGRLFTATLLVAILPAGTSRLFRLAAGI